MVGNIGASACWANFDSWTERMVAREVTFAVFAANTKQDFERMARIAARRRRLPSWMGLDDVANDLVHLAWHYALERVSKADGREVVGYQPGMYRSGAGAYVRWKIRAKIGKLISRARGENQHRRSGPGAPEYLSKTGEHGGVGGLPELPVDSTAELEAERSMRFDRLERLCESPRETLVLRAIRDARGDEDDVAKCIVRDPRASDEGLVEVAAARGAVKEFVREWSRDLGAVGKPSARKGAEVWAAA
jgi:hypothetical protein